MATDPGFAAFVVEQVEGAGDVRVRRTFAKPYLLLSDELDDRALLAALLRRTVAEVPEPKPKKTRKKLSAPPNP